MSTQGDFFGPTNGERDAFLRENEGKEIVVNHQYFNAYGTMKEGNGNNKGVYFLCGSIIHFHAHNICHIDKGAEYPTIFLQ
jgi:hypothetical protein